MTAVYVDSSALVKLVVPEQETAALETELRHHDEWLAATVCVTEVLRATHRWVKASGTTGRAAATCVNRAQEVLRSLALIDVDLATLFRAGSVEPAEVRTLDAIHLATAIDLAADLEGFVTYDQRLADAALTAGLAVLSPR